MNDEEIFDMLNQEAQNIEIPESVRPDNMMQKIENNIQNNNMTEQKQSGKKNSNRRKWIYRSLVTGGTLMAASLGIFTAKIVYDRGINKENIVKVKRFDNEEEKSDQRLMMAGEGTNNVKSASGKEEILKVILNSTKAHYLGSKGAIFNEEMVTADGAVAEDESLLDFNGISFESNQKDDNSNHLTENASSDDGDYYKNNDQVEGIKEPDTVITDGKNIYSVYQNNEIKVTAVDGENMRVASDINLEADIKSYFSSLPGHSDEEYAVSFYDSEVYVTEGTLISLVDGYVYQDNRDKEHNDIDYDDFDYYDYYNFYDRGEEYNVILQYDLSDLDNPKLVDVHRIDGFMTSSRMSGKYLYVVTEKGISDIVYEINDLEDAIEYEEELLPKVDGEEIAYSDVYLPEGDTEISNYVIITAFEINDDGIMLTDNSAILSDYSELYVSENYIYTFPSYGNYEETKYVNDDGIKMVHRMQSTKIYKFGYSNGNIEPSAAGVVKGSILNQFSLDEYNGYLRLVSTVTDDNYLDYAEYENEFKSEDGFDDYDKGIWELWERYSNIEEYNALYILDENLNTCGKIENIAKNERIYSARFSGDKGYFVTFRQMDPLFVVDLSDVNHPVITGELEMTGYSGYLHQWSEDTLLGIGVEATEQGRAVGFKIALYDTGEDEELNEITKLVIEGKNSYDEYNYKNMMVAPEKSFVGVNLSWYDVDEIEDFYEYKSIYSLFSVKDGAISRELDYNYTDYFENSDTSECYYDSVYRGLYIGDYLYIVTRNKGISAISLTDFVVKDTITFE